MIQPAVMVFASNLHLWAWLLWLHIADRLWLWSTWAATYQQQQLQAALEELCSTAHQANSLAILLIMTIPTVG